MQMSSIEETVTTIQIMNEAKTGKKMGPLNILLESRLLFTYPVPV